VTGLDLAVIRSRAPVTGGDPLGRFLRHPGPVTSHLLHRVAHLLSEAAMPVALVLGGAALIGLSTRAALRASRRRGFATDARWVRILPPPEVDPAGGEALWSNLVALLRPAWRRILSGQPHLGFEYVWQGAELKIGLWVPGPVPPGLVERAVEAAWPGARTLVVVPFSPLPGDGPATAGTLRLASAEWLPLRTDHSADPLRSVLGAAAGLDTDEVAAVQILARPASGRRLARARRAAWALRAGGSQTAPARLLHLSGPSKVRARPVGADPEQARVVKEILDKAGHPQWFVGIRYAAATARQAPDARARLRGRAHAIASAFALYTGPHNRLRRRRLSRPAGALAVRQLGRGDLLSVPELAAMAHLPTDVAVPGLSRAGARLVAPRPGIPIAGKVLGDAAVGAARPVALAVEDARQHLHVMGATGSGKSTLLANLILDDVVAGRGAVVIDPKGDLVADLLDRLPRPLAQAAVLLDPEETEAPPALNVLEGPDTDLAVDNLVGIFRRIFEAYWGPRTDDVLRAACLTLLYSGGEATLADVPRLLAEEPFRRRLTAGIADPVGLGGFWAWYEGMGEAQRAQVIGPVMNKLRAFLLRDFVRKVVGSSRSSFDLARVLDGGLCLVRVPKGVLGEETARLLGSFVVAKVWQAATHRARIGQHARVDASLYVDECQNFLTLPRSLEEMLAEARGYRLSLVLAHQHLAQLPRDLRDAVSANARSKVIFAASPEDARILERHTLPEITAHDLAHMPAYNAAARLVVGGEDLAAFTVRTRPIPAPLHGRADQIRERARAAYGRTDEQRRTEALRMRRSRSTRPAGQSLGQSSGRSAGQLDRPTQPDPSTLVRAADTPDGATPDLVADSR
jgi:hypothetical protein